MKWIGVFENDEVDDLASKLGNAIATKEVNTSKDFCEISHSRGKINITVRPIIFAPDRPVPRENQIRYIPGEEMINYCWLCFRPSEIRETCATDYHAINNWGHQYEEILRYFKNPDKHSASSMEDFYTAFN